MDVSGVVNNKSPKSDYRYSACDRCCQVVGLLEGCELVSQGKVVVSGKGLLVNEFRCFYYSLSDEESKDFMKLLNDGTIVAHSRVIRTAKSDLPACPEMQSRFFRIDKGFTQGAMTPPGSPRSSAADRI